MWDKDWVDFVLVVAWIGVWSGLVYFLPFVGV